MNIPSTIKTKPMQAILFALWCFAVYQIIITGFKPDPYMSHYYPEKIHEYPIGFVSLLLGAMAVQAVTAIILHVLFKSRWRIVIILLINICFIVLSALMSMHAPPTLTIFMLWQFALFPILIVLLFLPSVGLEGQS